MTATARRLRTARPGRRPAPDVRPARARFVPVVSQPARRLRRRDARAPVHRLRRARRAHAGGRRRRARAGAARDGAARPGRVHRAAVAAGVVPRRARPADRASSTPRLDRAASCSAVAEAAPQADVVLVHAGAADLCRLFARSATLRRAVLLAEDRPTSVTHAYAAMKLLAQRAGLMRHDLLLGAAPNSPRAERIAEQMASCADDFLGAVLRDWAPIDPAGDATEAPTRRRCAAWSRSCAACDRCTTPLARRRRPRHRWTDPRSHAVRRMISGADHVHRQRPAGPELDAQAVQPAGAPPGAPDDRQAAGQRRDRRPDPGRHDRPDRRAVAASTPPRACSSRPSPPSASAAPCSTSCAATTSCRAARASSSASIESAVHKLEQQLGRAPARKRDRRARWASRLAEYQELLGKVRGTQLVYLEDMARRRRRQRLPRPPRRRRGRPTRWRSCRTTACARRWSRRSRSCPSASST